MGQTPVVRKLKRTPSACNRFWLYAADILVGPDIPADIANQIIADVSASKPTNAWVGCLLK